MNLNKLNADDLCKLIKACKEAGVTELSFGLLKINFGPQTKVEESPRANQPEQIEVNQAEANRKLEILTTLVKEAEEKDSSAMLLIDDPLEMENRIASGDWIDDSGSNDQKT